MTITLPGNPVSTNHVWKHACRAGRLMSYMTDEGRSLKESYQWAARSQHKGQPLPGPLSLSITLYFADNRRRDWDNWHKLSMDALNRIVWQDDSQVKEAVVRKEIDKEKPRIEIVISQL